jgi:hypothetical protein
VEQIVRPIRLRFNEGSIMLAVVIDGKVWGGTSADYRLAEPEENLRVMPDGVIEGRWSASHPWMPPGDKASGAMIRSVEERLNDQAQSQTK